MNYKESKLILEKIKKVKSILVNCHKNPDPDSIGSALALEKILLKMGKDVKLICPTKLSQTNLSFLDNLEKIETIDFSKFDFAKFDLFVCLDSSSWDMVSDQKVVPSINIPILVIDHHRTNTRYGKINLIDHRVTSVGELLYLVFSDWNISIDKDVATALLTGIIGDTGVFRYHGTGFKTLDIASRLMKLGADKDLIVFNVYHRTSFEIIKFWKEILERMKFEENLKFIWSAIPYESYVKYKGLKAGRESGASQFAQIIDGTDFGVIMVEEEKGKLSISFRSRTGFDTSRIAVELGGGGHVYASGASIEGLPFEKAVEKVLEVCRKYAKQKS